MTASHLNQPIVAPRETIATTPLTVDVCNQGTSNAKHDPMRRLVPTSHHCLLPVMGRTVHLETNSSELLTRVSEIFARYSIDPRGAVEFVWRIVVEDDLRSSPPWPGRSTFSDEGIRFAQFGQRNFLAVDIEAREAVCFVSKGLFDDAQGFNSPFIDTLSHMSAGPLGLVPFASACVSSGDHGLLVLGQPNQGKTTASYLATRDGLTFHSDQSVFLEVADSQLRGWGDFVPLAFRREGLQFLPELCSKTRLFSYCDFNFYYLAKPRSFEGLRPFVAPACCVVLERGASSAPHLEPIESSDFSHCLSAHIAFRDDGRFDEQNRKVLAELGRLPAYRLTYGNDPADAAPFFHLLLRRHSRRIPEPSMDAR